MEQRDLITDNLQVSENTAHILGQTVRWARFLAIVGFAMTGFMLLASYVLPELIAMNRYTMPEMNVPVQGLRINMIIVAILMFIPCLFLFRFSTRMKDALTNHHQEAFDESIQNLKSTFKFYGILTIIILSIYALALVVGLMVTLFEM